ncbi:serine/threonine-protein phosphatase 4 regulatory subunit 2-A-like [Vigna umbellata]|uniref:serine/threonine-protein phosphatase 4 regulatory subunit 2-A-like n=1 Tax=Vigna umbellata TaxID=87088 RepID=UPI001F5EC569|nr:serine/threonine-protein phosphatase 4 regulatory subunit 2-A-like [Vigna umbellata]
MPDRTYKHIDTARSPTSIASVEHFLRSAAGDSSRMSPTSSSPSSPMKQQDLEEDQGLYQKKSVLTKVKQKARKFCNSLSKKRIEDDNVTPSSRARFADEEEEEEIEEEEEDDAEYLGAPMYESEQAPETYKENARQHPRANPVISEKHVLHNAVKLGMQEDQEKPSAAVNPKLTSTTQPNTATTVAASSSNDSETLAQKMIPAYAAGSLSANSIPSQNSSVSSSRLQHSFSSPASQSRKNTSQNVASVNDYLKNKSEKEGDAKIESPKQDLSSSSASKSGKITQKTLSFKDYSTNRSEQGNDATNMIPLQKSSSFSVASLRGKNTGQKSALAKDYSMSKSEPRDDIKTESQPQVTYGENGPSNSGMMDKVRGAVNSLLGNEEPSEEYGVKIPTTRTSSQTQQVYFAVGEDENRGRILQAN